MYEVLYATTRLARIDATDIESAKRRFAAYALYDDGRFVVGDVELSFGDDAAVTPLPDDAPTSGSRAELHAWIARNDAATESFEVGLFEDPERTIDTYLRLLATNDPWRLEGHGSLGRPLSSVPVVADLVTFDRRVTYRFDATQFLDYIRLDIVSSLDPLHPHESIHVGNLIDVAALRDEQLRQISSAYESIAREFRLTAEFATATDIDRVFDITFAAEPWQRYVAHRIAEPQRFVPPPGWTSQFPTYGDS